VFGKQRKDCTYCRYEKCLAVGMSPQLILSEDEKERLFRKYRQEIITSIHQYFSWLLYHGVGVQKRFVRVKIPGFELPD
jgi:hypothetical protein